MRFNVFFDNFIGHIPCRDSKIASCPQVSTPILPFQLTKLLHQPSTTSPFQLLDHLTHRQFGRYAQQQMHMIFRHMSRYDVDFQLLTTLPYQFPQSQRNRALQNRFSIFCHPHDVIFQVIHRVRCFSITHQRHWIQFDHVTMIMSGRLARYFNTRRTSQPDPMLKTACLKGRGFRPYLQTIKKATHLCRS